MNGYTHVWWGMERREVQVEGRQTSAESPSRQHGSRSTLEGIVGAQDNGRVTEVEVRKGRLW